MYTQKYGLHHRPFENTPDPQFLYLSKIHREVLSSLIYGVNSSKGFILISGDIGTGKTTLVHAFLREIQDSNIVLHIINPRTSFAEIVVNLARKLKINLKGINNSQLVEIIREKLKVLDSEDKRAVIIIDEAHLLSEASLEDIRILSNIETEKKKLIQIILVGQNEIHDLLNQNSQTPLKQRIVLNRKLTPFNKKDCFEYIMHRLNIAGTSTQLFNHQALNQIWKKSRGIPRLINQICDNALLIGFALDKSIIGVKVIKEVIKDMEAGSKSILQNTKKTNAPKALKLAVMCVIVCIAFMFIIDPRVVSNFSNMNAPHQETEADFFTYAIKEDLPKISTVKSNVEKGINSVSTTRKEFMPQPIVNIGTNVEFLQGKNSNQQKQILPDEYLLTIAQKEYGIGNHMIIDLIHMVNPEIKNINKIFYGQKIVLPFIEKEDLIVKNANGNFHIHYTSYYNYSDTSKIIQKLGNDNHVVFSLPVRQGETLVYRVYIGIFDDKISALGYLKGISFDHLPFLE